MPDLARIAYEAYGVAVDGRNFMGEPMPAWEDLHPVTQQGWFDAAQAVASAVRGEGA